MLVFDDLELGISEGLAQGAEAVYRLGSQRQMELGIVG